MKPRVLAVDAPIMELNEEILYTASLLHSYPFLAVLATDFDKLDPDWFALLRQELALVRDRLEAEARVIAVDDRLDRLCVAIAATLLALCNGDRKHSLYQRYFKGVAPSKLKRPILGRQLEIMRTWVPSLEDPGSPDALRAYGAELKQCVSDADQVVLGLAESERQRADFQIGARKQFVDKLNAGRHAIYGKLSEMIHGQPELKLERDFAHRFFLRNSTRRTEPTIAELEQKLIRLAEETRKYEELLAQKLAEQEALEQAEMDAEAAEIDAEIERAEELLAVALARKAALGTSLGPSTDS